ncbi:Ferredoxin-thioredoxin reductase, catalytic subunit [Alkalispirochaeta americana]|uniref:ferredoxin:thioredoxin reductase n=1 Tax=Alkalispirochaeta americana TaxID=159291 RepID=A0A1N6VPS2_9SPIO|nr:ferredoxin-thioredoxin reductase catalytic domain-containing protein [Alkalispirochaeta americana]SIQ79871.1 Ferredoxin-thioredoxin reductase, catalytic subunit [Alkalispirochaeta americana]
MKQRTVEETQHFIDKAARHYGWVPVGDAQFRQRIAQGLTDNVNRYGYYLCPCRDGEGLRQEDRDIICPCTYAAPDIADYGQCFCGLFLSPEKSREGGDVSQIPERRPLER